MRTKRGATTVQHDYFDRLWLWPPGYHTRWEAELSVPGTSKTVGFHSETTHETVPFDGPTEAEVAFCKRWMSDGNALFEFTRPAIEVAWKDWVETAMPEQWQTALSLNGLSVPDDGDIKQPWGVTWFCEPVGHYISIAIRDGLPFLESVDG